MNRINEKIVEFYINNSYLKGDKYLPMFYDSPSENHTVLSIGLNPSLTNAASLKLDDKELWLEHFIKSDDSTKNLKIQEVVRLQKALKSSEKKIPYFKYLETFFEEVGYPNFEESIYHYDLYQKRITNSKDVINEFSEEKHLLPELINHLELVIDQLQPKIIFVFNATVSKLLKENSFLSSNNLDDELGCYFKKNIPVILANQLSGGATSTIYRDILIWNTKRIINKTA
jgi:hypothetical protein